MRKIVALTALCALWTSNAFAAYYGPTPFGVTVGGTGLASLTLHAVVIGEGTGNVAFVGPNAASGLPLISGGSSADPTFGVALVPGGGTGVATIPPNSVMLGAGTGNIHTVGTSATADSVVAWGAAGSDPAALAVNDCTGAGKALTYVVSTHAFGCNTISAGAAPSYALGASSASITLASTNLLTTGIATTVTTATLPSAVTVGTGFRECVKDVGRAFATNNVTLKSGAGTIDGVAAGTGVVLNQNYQEVCALSDGTNWWIE